MTWDSQRAVSVASRLPSQFSRTLERVNGSRRHSDEIVNLLISPEFALDKSLQAQIMTPGLRSMPQVSPLFDKLFEIGSKILDIHCSIFALSRTGGAMFNAPTPQKINELSVVKAFVGDFGLDNAVIQLQHRSPMSQSELLDASVDCLMLLIGAVYVTHGGAKAGRFITESIIDGRSGLYRMLTRRL